MLTYRGLDLVAIEGQRRFDQLMEYIETHMQGSRKDMMERMQQDTGMMMHPEEDQEILEGEEDYGDQIIASPAALHGAVPRSYGR